MRIRFSKKSDDDKKKSASDKHSERLRKLKEKLDLQELRIREESLKLRERENKLRSSKLDSSSSSKKSTFFNKDNSSAVSAIGLSLLTGGMLNPVVIEKLGLDRRLKKGINSTFSTFASTTKSATDIFSSKSQAGKATKKQMDWLKTKMFGEKPKDEEEEDIGEKTDNETNTKPEGLFEKLGLGRTKKKSKVTGSAVESTADDAIVNRLDTIIELLGGKKKKEDDKKKKKEDDKEGGFFSGLLGLLKTFGGMAVMGVAAGAIGSLFENPILPSAIAGGILGFKTGGFRGLLVGGLIGAAAGGFIATKRDFDKRMEAAKNGVYQKPSSIGPLSYSEFTGVLAGAMAGFTIYGPVGALVGGALGFAIGWIYDLVNNRKLKEEAGYNAARKDLPIYRQLDDATKKKLQDYKDKEIEYIRSNENLTEEERVAWIKEIKNVKTIDELHKLKQLDKKAGASRFNLNIRSSDVISESNYKPGNGLLLTGKVFSQDEIDIGHVKTEEQNEKIKELKDIISKYAGEDNTLSAKEADELTPGIGAYLKGEGGIRKELYNAYKIISDKSLNNDVSTQVLDNYLTDLHELARAEGNENKELVELMRQLNKTLADKVGSYLSQLVTNTQNTTNEGTSSGWADGKRIVTNNIINNTIPQSDDAV